MDIFQIQFSVVKRPWVDGGSLFSTFFSTLYNKSFLQTYILAYMRNIKRLDVFLSGRGKEGRQNKEIIEMISDLDKRYLL